MDRETPAQRQGRREFEAKVRREFKKSGQVQKSPATHGGRLGPVRLNRMRRTDRNPSSVDHLAVARSRADTQRALMEGAIKAAKRRGDVKRERHLQMEMRKIRRRPFITGPHTPREMCIGQIAGGRRNHA
jgi:hypothetical protein